MKSRGHSTEGLVLMAKFWFFAALQQVLPGVYFGHLEPPDVSRLPASGRIVPWFLVGLIYKNMFVGAS